MTNPGIDPLAQFFIIPQVSGDPKIRTTIELDSQIISFTVSYEKEECWYFEEVKTIEEQRSRGYGGWLVKDTCDHLLTISRKPFLVTATRSGSTEVDIERVIRFYEKCGFQRVEVTNWMFKDI